MTQIKYTLVYDERVDKEPIEKFLKEYENLMKSKGLHDLEASKETVIDAISGELIEMDNSEVKQKSMHA